MSKKIYLFSTSSIPNVINVNSLEITFFKPSIDFSKYDYLILTSKQAVNSLQQYDKERYIDKPALCISKATAKNFEALGAKVLHTGEGYGDNLARIIKQYPKDRRWLYLRAEEIASDFVKICKKDGYTIDEAILYKSSCSSEIQEIQVDANAILIFTSPSSIKCFLKKHDILNTQKVIVIGKTTAKSLPKGIPYLLPGQPSIGSCLQLLPKLTTIS